MVIALLVVHALEVFHSGANFGLLLFLFDVVLVVVYFIFDAPSDTSKRDAHLLLPSVRIVCVFTIPAIWATTLISRPRGVVALFVINCL